MQTTESGRYVDGSNRTIARIVGVLFISAFFAYGGGNALIASIPTGADHLPSIAANAAPLRAGALLMLMNSLFVAAIGVLMLRVARPHNETIAFAYLTARLVESVFLAVGVVFLLLQLALAAEHAAGAAAASLESLNAISVQGNFVAYQIGMIGLGLVSVPFWYVFFRARLIPRILAALGMAGYAIFATGAIAELAGLEIGLILSLPGALFEVAVATWLIVKGFASPVTHARRSSADAPALPAEVAAS